MPPCDDRSPTSAGKRAGRVQELNREPMKAGVEASDVPVPETAAVVSVKKSKDKVWTLAEMREAKECLILIERSVYEVSPEWMKKHPAGEIILRNCKGTDATAPFTANHRPEAVEKLLKAFKVGEIEADYKIPERTEEYIGIMKKLQSDPEWFQFSPFYYLRMMSWYVVLLSSSIYCVCYGDSTFMRVVVAGVLMGAFWQQIAFMGHDVGHNGITHMNKFEELFGICIGANPLMGISCGWWKATHNVHHLVTNSVEYDCDIQHMPALAVDPVLLKGFYSFYHMKKFEVDAFAKVLLRYQAFLYYPIMMLARFNLYYQSMIFLSNETEYRRRGGKYRFLELTMLGVFWCWFITLCQQLPTGWEIFGFVLLSHAVTGLLHVQITISHFPMPVLEGVPLQEREFVDFQLETCMDVTCSPWMDWFHGGLQFQAEHHLFPRIPRHNMRRVRDDILKPFCKKHGLEYNETDFITANKMVLACLANTTAHLHEGIVDGWNATG